MAEANISVIQDQFSCPVCLDLLKDPVTIPCGHSYCMSCITGCWDQEDQKGVYSCPQCRQTFTLRPVLGKNTMLADVVEKLRKIKLQSTGPAHCYAGPTDVECDICTGRKRKAVKSCLLCLESYCQTHFDRHEEFRSGKRHKVIDATGRLKEIICSQHDKLLEIYCRNEQKCICILCMVDEHKNHNIVSTSAERTEKQRQLEDTLKTFQQRIQDREKYLQELRKTVESHKVSFEHKKNCWQLEEKLQIQIQIMTLLQSLSEEPRAEALSVPLNPTRSAQAAVKDSERVFAELIRSIEKSRSEVTQLIRDQEKAAVAQAEGLMERLEQEIADLRRRNTELEQLSHTEDHIHFLQSFQSLSVSPGSAVLPNITVGSLLPFDDVEKSVSRLREKLKCFCREEIEKLPGRVRCKQIIPPEYECRTYFHKFTLDSNTAYKNLCLSEGNRVITWSKSDQQYPDHPDRFNSFAQVLCSESVCGRCYWEVERSGSEVEISVSYTSISRKGWGKECGFGQNYQSWSLCCSDSSCSFSHNMKMTKLPVVPMSFRIGVYVDYSAGTLSFYSVSDTMTLIHRVQTTFTQPLYPGFWVKNGSAVKLCDLTI